MLSTEIRRLALAALIVSPSIAGCAAPLAGPARDVSQRAASLLAAAPTVYGPDAAQVPAAAENARVRATFESALPPAAKATLAHEAALDTVAAVIADMVATDQQAPSQALLEWLCWRAGAVSRLARTVVMTTAGIDDLDLQTADLAAKVQASAYPEAFGIARSARGRPAQAMVWSRRLLAVDRLPKAYAPGAPITLKVKPLDAFTELRFHADDEAGGVVDEEMTAAAGGSFTVTHPAPGKPGRYFIEVTGLDPRTREAVPENPWRRSLFWVPVYVGVPEPAAPDPPFRAPAANPVDVTTWAARILDGYDEARAKAGKKALARDGRLNALALARSLVVALAGREPPPDTVLADKLAAAGFPPHDYDEQQARVDTLSDYVHLRLLQPSVRRRVLGSDALVVGLALTPNAPNAPNGGEIDYTLVEDQVDPVAPFDPAADRARVIAALDALQKTEGRPAYQHDKDVARVVQGFADEVCGGGKRANQMKPLVDKARGVGEKFHQWGTPVWRAGYDYTRWEEMSLLAKSTEPPFSHAEVGLCQGNLPGKPGGSYVVVIPYAP